MSHLRVSGWMAEGFSRKAQVMRAADQPFPKLLSTDLCKVIPHSGARAERLWVRTAMRGRGDEQLPASSAGQDLGSKPSQGSHEVVCRDTNTPKSRRACLPTATHLHIPGKCCCQSPARGAGAELQPLWTGLLLLPSRSCFVCKPSAQRPAAPAAARGPRWTGSLKIL